MRIVLFASGEFAVPTMRSLADPSKPGHEILCVITQPDRASGRGRTSQPTPARSIAEQLGLHVLPCADVNAPVILSRLSEFNADLGLVIAFGQKIKAPTRQIFRHECVNLHASLLPRYRGAAPFQWTIINGDRQAGVTVFRLVDRMDAGPIYVTRSTRVNEDERACELHDRLAMIGVDAVRATLELLQRNPLAEPAPQDETQVTTARKLSREDSLIRFDRPAREITNRIRGLWDWPGAKCRYVSTGSESKSAGQPRSETVTLALARTVDAGPAQEPPGTLDYRRYVATAEGYLEILEVKPDGARLMTFPEFVNGRHVRAGDRFEALLAEHA